MSLDQTHYDVAILSTGLPQSILSAALSAAGLSVIHLDENDYYADQWASLTLSELERWSRKSGKRPESRVQLTFPTAGSDVTEIPADLLALDRHYAISLAPTLLPATGPSIDTLIASKVSSYATFRLLEQTAVYTPTSQTRLAAVPASKEDIFKTKAISLIDKRRLMKLLELIAHSDRTVDETWTERPFAEYLAEVHKLSPDLISAVAYGVSMCPTTNEPVDKAMLRAEKHLKSTGRYGNSAYLVGQYGGAGELAQSYCRASAVKGGVFILDHRIESAQRRGESWEIDVAGVEQRITASYFVSGDELADRLLQSEALQHPVEHSSGGGIHRGVLVLGCPIDFAAHMSKQNTLDGDSTSTETGLIVFPPDSLAHNTNTIFVLMMGEGTFSCPKGQYVYYIQTEASDKTSPTNVVLKPVIDEVQKLAQGEAAIKPLMQLTYLQVGTANATPETNFGQSFAKMPFPPAVDADASSSLVSLTDSAVQLAQEVYYSVLASRLSELQGGFEEKRAQVKQAAQNRTGRRRKRDSSEYQGRGGRGSDDGVTKEAHDTQIDEHPSSLHDLIGFFESTCGEEDE